MILPCRTTSVSPRSSVPSPSAFPVPDKLCSAGHAERTPGLRLGRSRPVVDVGTDDSKKGSAPPRNPFAVREAKGGAEKRPRGIADSLSSLMGSPSPKRWVQLLRQERSLG